MAKEVTDNNFKAEVEEAKGTVMVDCWAPWCGPCRMLGPTIDKLAEEYDGKIKILKLNVDENQQTAMRYNIQSIPTVLIFKGGEVVDGFLGALPEQAVREKIEANL